ncbi:GerAB/ArcD/ProY family transporter [Brevibacillus reuszeri]|uniref:GerAB/ArcD/ProY family transporter n=1 Tax=Brevibacillus reuszeri TaxID=54915 RepID=UPI00289DF1A0|nr:GerAB/ArcD/ProY family transporter [Brevibacillus reuszeri]
MDRGKITNLNPYHVIGLVVNTIIGVNLLTLSNSLSRMGYNQWWFPIVLGIIATISLLPMIAICKRYPNDSLFAINVKLLGKHFGQIVNLLIIMYAILSATAVNSDYVRLVQTSMINNQTITLPLLGLVLVMLYITNCGIKLIARFCLISLFFTVWMFYYLQWGFQKGGIMHIFPLFNTNLSDMLDALNRSFASMFGFEVLLFYYPYIKQKGKVFQHVTIGIWICVTVYVLILLTSVAYFSEWEIENLVYPILNLFKAVELSFLERVENLGIGLWVFLVLSTCTTYMWVARKGIEETLGKISLWHLLLPAAISYFLIRSWIPLEFQDFLFHKMTLWLGYGLILWPLFLLLLHAIRFGSGGKAP